MELVPNEIIDLLNTIEGEMKRSELQSILKIKHRDYFTERFLKPAIEKEYIEMTIPDRPQSSNQRYRLTDIGKTLKEKMKKGEI